MALTTPDTNNEVIQWNKKFATEYIRDNRFKRYMGTDQNSVIMVNKDLTKKPGDTISCPLFTRLTGSGVTGNSTLEGNEEALNNYDHRTVVDQERNAVVVSDFDNQKTMVELLDAGRTANMNWAREQLRDKIIESMGSINGVAYGSATETQKDDWLEDNADRVLFGAAKSNNSSNDHSASLANIDNTDDKLSAGIVSLARRMAQTASPHIRPIRTTEDEEWFVMFCPTESFRDLKNDSTIQEANREAWQRGKDNPIFRAGDLLYDGVIIREVPEIGTLADVGAGAAVDVAPNYLCGAQAISVAYAKMPSAIKDVRDYGDKKGVGVRTWYGVSKSQYVDATNAHYDHGVVTVYTAGEPDA